MKEGLFASIIGTLSDALQFDLERFDGNQISCLLDASFSTRYIARMFCPFLMLGAFVVAYGLSRGWARLFPGKVVACTPPSDSTLSSKSVRSMFTFTPISFGRAMNFRFPKTPRVTHVFK